VISNNIANLRTTGYKEADRGRFQGPDLRTHPPRRCAVIPIRAPSFPSASTSAAASRDRGHPALDDARHACRMTGNDLDLSRSPAEGFFKIQQPDGTFQ